MAAPFQKIALITGISGQDGAYLSEFLLARGYRVVGTSRDATAGSWTGLKQLGIASKIFCVSMDPNDFRSVLQTIFKEQPNEIYHLAGQSSVGLSFEQPVEAIESIALSTLNLLEAIRFTGRPIRLYCAGSSECFGESEGAGATELTPMRPRSPYAVAKTCAHNLVANYREAYNIFACTGILFNHESPLRSERFVTQKIIQTACRIAHGQGNRLVVGNMDIHRDWGWAPEFVKAMWMMLQQPQPQDFVIATGRTVSLQYYIERTFSFFKLNWREFVEQDKSLFRPSDIRFGAADPFCATNLLGWAAQCDVDYVIDEMCRQSMENFKNSNVVG